jgi:hypothetical protein
MFKERRSPIGDPKVHIVRQAGHDCRSRLLPREQDNGLSERCMSRRMEESNSSLNLELRPAQGRHTGKTLLESPANYRSRIHTFI